MRMMAGSPPSIEFTEIRQYRGEIRRNGLGLAVHSLTVRFKMHPGAGALTFELVGPRDQRDEFMSIAASDTFEFHGTWEQDENMVKPTSPEIRMTLVTLEWDMFSARVTGVVTALYRGAEVLSEAPLGQTFSARFTRSRAANRPAKRSILSGGQSEFEVETDSARCSVGTYMMAEDAWVGMDRASLAVPVVLVSGRIKTDAMTPSLVELLERLRDEMVDLEWVLSLLSRHSVRCWGIELESTEPNRVLPVTASVLLGGPNVEREPPELVDPFAMPKQSLNELLGGFRASRHRGTLERAIPLLLNYWQANRPEDQIGAAFTALETMTSGIGDVIGPTDVIDKATMKALRRYLSVVLAAPESPIADNQYACEWILKRTADLRRRAFPVRVAALAEAHAIEWEDVWRPEPGVGYHLETSIRKAYSRRSSFVHAGEVDPLVLRDITSVHATAERLALAVLGVQQDWLRPWAYSYAHKRHSLG